MLHVTVAEVQRPVLKQLGVNLSAGELDARERLRLRLLDLAGSGLARCRRGCSRASNRARSPASSRATASGKDVTSSVVRALERAGADRASSPSRRSSPISGESAKFLAGGEIPDPDGRELRHPDGPQPARSASATSRIGVSAQLHADRALRGPHQPARRDRGLGDRPRRSRSGSRPISVPGVKTACASPRRPSSCPSGATLVTAGLIQQSSTPGDQRLPRPHEPAGPRRPVPLARLPAPGDRADDHGHALHRQADGARTRSTRPDDGFVDAHDAQAVLLGRLNKLYGIAGAAARRRPIKGQSASSRTERRRRRRWTDETTAKVQDVASAFRQHPLAWLVPAGASAARLGAARRTAP